MSEVMEVQADAKPCANPECPTLDPESTVFNSLVEPEVDGDHRYYECEECGYAFGYERVGEGIRVEGACAAGVPESVRRAASAPMEGALADEKKSQPVPVTIRRRGEQ